MSLYKVGADVSQASAPQKQDIKPGMVAIGATLLLFVGIAMMNRPKARAVRGGDVSDIEAKLRARGRNPRSYF